LFRLFVPLATNSDSSSVSFYKKANRNKEEGRLKEILGSKKVLLCDAFFVSQGRISPVKGTPAAKGIRECFSGKSNARFGLNRLKYRPKTK
jgi:hypothetical protein